MLTHDLSFTVAAAAVVATVVAATDVPAAIAVDANFDVVEELSTGATEVAVANSHSTADTLASTRLLLLGKRKKQNKTKKTKKCNVSSNSLLIQYTPPLPLTPLFALFVTNTTKATLVVYVYVTATITIDAVVANKNCYYSHWPAFLLLNIKSSLVYPPQRFTENSQFGDKKKQTKH